jgi:hypothetical protein
VLFYVFVMNRHFEGSWGGFFIFLVDFPASLPALLVSNVLRIRTDYVLLVLGTAWWFLLGIGFSIVLTWLSTRARRVSEAGSR